MAIVVGISLVWPGTFLDAMWNLNRKAYEQFAFLGRVAGLLLFVVAMLTAVAGTNLLKGGKLGWWMAVFIFALNGAGDLVNCFIMGEILKGFVGLVIASGFLLYLFRPATRKYFEGSSAAGIVSSTR
jgi:hypothetical protein